MTHKTIALLALLMIFTTTKSHAQASLDVESGVVFDGYNNVRVPGKGGTLFSLSDDLNTLTKVFYRLRLSYLFNKKHYVSLLYAPLTLTAEGSFDTPVTFEQTVFSPNVNVTGKYQFNSYRLTYRFMFARTQRFQFGVGVTAKIRDARITLTSELQSDEKTNVGFVPLINFYAEWFVKERLSLVLKGDALAAPQGRAEDVLLAAYLYPSRNLTFKLGYRVLEGGADNDEVYNFSLLHYAVIGAIITL